MAAAGCTVFQIATVSGHDVSYVQKIIDTYVPMNGAMVRAGMHCW